MFTRWSKDSLNLDNMPEKAHTGFSRQLSEMGKAVHKAYLYKEFGRKPLMLQWLILAARLRNKMVGRDEKALMNMALKTMLL
jgi:hypothetical protein